MDKHTWIARVILIPFCLGLLTGCIGYSISPITPTLVMIPTSQISPSPEVVTTEHIICDAYCPVFFDVIVWEDLNQDGSRDENEPPLPGVMTHLAYSDSVFILNVSEPKLTDEKGSTELEFWVGCPCEPPTPSEDIISSFSVKVVATPPSGCKLTTPDKLSQWPYQFGFWCSDEQTMTPTIPTPTGTPL